MKISFLIILVLFTGCIFVKQVPVTLQSVYEIWGGDCVELAESPLMIETGGSWYRLPEYPGIAKFFGTEGWVVVAIKVQESGAVDDVIVLDSFPNQIFDRSAIRESFNRQYKQLETHEPKNCYIDIYKYTYDLP